MTTFLFFSNLINITFNEVITLRHKVLWYGLWETYYRMNKIGLTSDYFWQVWEE